MEEHDEINSIGWERRSVAVLKACHYAGGGVIFFIMVLTAIHAVMRYGFDAPIAGVIDLSQLGLITTVFLVAAYTLIVKGHVTIGIVADRLSPRVQGIIDSLTYILSLAFLLLGASQAWVKGMELHVSGLATQTLRIPLFPFYFVVAVGYVLVTFAAIIHLINSISRAVKK